MKYYINLNGQNLSHIWKNPTLFLNYRFQDNDFNLKVLPTYYLITFVSCSCERFYGSMHFNIYFGLCI